jgi:hypothetical protein
MKLQTTGQTVNPGTTSTSICNDIFFESRSCNYWEETSLRTYRYGIKHVVVFTMIERVEMYQAGTLTSFDRAGTLWSWRMLSLSF